jgi:hypothetical protein
MKNIVTFLALIIMTIISLNCHAQDLTTVAISKFTSNKTTKYKTFVENKVSEFMQSSGQFKVISKNEIEKIKRQLYEQASEYYIDSEVTVEQGKMLQAKYILTGNLEVINITRKRNASGGITGYWCTIAFTIKIIDVETGSAKSITSFTTKKGKGMSPETSIIDALDSVEKKLKKFFKKVLL